MKIIITGSLGNISKPLTKELVGKGHTVTVISSKSEKQKDIEALGAAAAIGSIEDVNFLTAAFAGADAVYCMIPPNHFVEADPVAYYRRIANNYAQAIQQSGVKRIVHLSTYGTHLDKGTGLILGSRNAEKILNELSDLAITHMRPTYFYYNVLAFVNSIKKTGAIAANYGADKVVMVSPTDIAAAVADEIVTLLAGRKIRYVASDELTGNEIAGILGEAIGIPDLKWIVITDEEMRTNYEAVGMPAQLITGLVEMFATLRTGKLAEDYYRNKPAVMGKVKFKDYAKEFAGIFQQK
jgi:uncharacterized protein YbjT (DUF2867 family)